ncbi:MAG: hypothetical protein AABY49_12770 [Planctomycetota bacterium]
MDVSTIHAIRTFSVIGMYRGVTRGIRRNEEKARRNYRDHGKPDSNLQVSYIFDMKTVTGYQPVAAYFYMVCLPTETLSTCILLTLLFF